MKYNLLKKKLESAGCVLLRHGGNHDIWHSPITGLTKAVPRHGSKEVPTGTLKSLYRDLLGL